MMKRLILLSAILLASCSTIDRRTYFSPQGELGEHSGPKKQYCGMHQFGNDPDKLTYEGLTYNANESYEPYFWGPWLITVVPTFPVTWLVDIFVSPKLSLTVTTTSAEIKLPHTSEFVVVVNFGNNEIRPLFPESSTLIDGALYLTFPVESEKVESFTLNNVEFIKTVRWAWTQVCIN